MEMQSAASEAEQPSATALLLLPEGWRWLQDQLEVALCPAPSNPLNGAHVGAFGWSRWPCASTKSTSHGRANG